jgi:hypothetical protein
MTLIVAKVTKHDLFLLADTRIQHPGKSKSVTEGMIKILLLSPSVAVAFTGDPDLAQQHVAEFKSKFGSDRQFDITLEYFRKVTDNNENEYLLAFAGPRRLFHLLKGRKQEKKQVWLGDISAFERFQEGVRPGKPFNTTMTIGPDVVDGNRLHDQVFRFQEVIEDLDIDSVGDFFTLAISPAGQFRLPLVGTLYYDIGSRLLGPNGSLMLSATGENRIHSYAIWTPKDVLTPGAAFVFSEAKKCFVFHASSRPFADQCTVFDGLH